MSGVYPGEQTDAQYLGEIERRLSNLEVGTNLAKGPVRLGALVLGDLVITASTGLLGEDILRVRNRMTGQTGTIPIIPDDA